MNEQEFIDILKEVIELNKKRRIWDGIKFRKNKRGYIMKRMKALKNIKRRKMVNKMSKKILWYNQ